MNTEMRTYHLSPRRKAFMTVLWVFIWGWLSFAIVASGGQTNMAISVTLCVLMLPLFAVVARRYPKLILKADGIERHNIGYRLVTNWENITALRLNPGSEGLILQRPMTNKGAWRFATFASASTLYGPELGQLIRERRFIPIEVFAYWWRNGDLKHQIESRAPLIAAAPDQEGMMKKMPENVRKGSPW